MLSPPQAGVLSLYFHLQTYMSARISTTIAPLQMTENCEHMESCHRIFVDFLSLLQQKKSCQHPDHCPVPSTTQSTYMYEPEVHCFMPATDKGDR